MKVILTDNVVGLGDIGETVSVRPGYARNFLIPRGLAFESDTSHARVIAHKMRQVDAKRKKLKGQAAELADKLRNTTLQFTLRVASGGKVFGSVGPKDIATKLTEAGFVLDRRRVLLTEPLKKVGTHLVKVRLHTEVEAMVKVVIEELQASKEQEDAETREARENVEAAVEAGDEADTE